MQKEGLPTELYSSQQLISQAEAYEREVGLKRFELREVRRLILQGSLPLGILQRRELLYKDLISRPEQDPLLKSAVALLRQKRQEGVKSQEAEPKLPKLTINQNTRKVDIQGRRLIVAGSIQWLVLTHLAENAEKDIPSKEIEEIARKGGSKTRHPASSAIGGLLKRLEPDYPLRTRLITRSGSAEFTKYRLNAEVEWIGEQRDFATVFRKPRESSSAAFEIILPDRTTVVVTHDKTAKALGVLIKTSKDSPVRTDDLAKILLGAEDRQSLDYVVSLISKTRSLLRHLGWQVIQSIPKGELGVHQRGLYHLEKLPEGENKLEKTDSTTQEFPEKVPVLKIRVRTREVLLEGWEFFKKINSKVLWNLLLHLAHNSNQEVPSLMIAELLREVGYRSQDPSKESIRSLRAFFGGSPTSRLLIASVHRGLYATYRLNANVEFIDEEDKPHAKLSSNAESPKEPTARIEANLENGEIKVYYPDGTSKTTRINGKVLWDIFLLFAKSPQENIRSKNIAELARQSGAKTKWAVGGLVRELRKLLEINPKGPSLIICTNDYRKDYQYSLNAEVVLIGQEDATSVFLSKIEERSKKSMEARKMLILIFPDGQQIPVSGFFRVKLLEYLIGNFQQTPITVSDIARYLYGKINDETLKKSMNLLPRLRKLLENYAWRISKQGQKAGYKLEKIPVGSPTATSATLDFRN